MFNAQEARAESEKNRGGMIATCLDQISKQVKEASRKGYFAISFPAKDVPYNLQEQLRTEVERFGYKAKYESGDQRDPQPLTLEVTWSK